MWWWGGKSLELHSIAAKIWWTWEVEPWDRKVSNIILHLPVFLRWHRFGGSLCKSVEVTESLGICSVCSKWASSQSQYKMSIYFWDYPLILGQLFTVLHSKSWASFTMRSHFSSGYNREVILPEPSSMTTVYKKKVWNARKTNGWGKGWWLLWNVPEESNPLLKIN